MFTFTSAAAAIKIVTTCHSTHTIVDTDDNDDDDDSALQGKKCLSTNIYLCNLRFNSLFFIFLNSTP